MAEISPLRRRMIDDMMIRNLSPATQQSYLYAIAKFEREHLEIPASVERQLVVGEHIGAALRRREVRQDDARHLVEAEQMRSEHPAVAGDNAVLFVDQHRVGEAKFADRGGDLRDLLVAVRARVSGVVDKRRAPAPNNRLG